MSYALPLELIIAIIASIDREKDLKLLKSLSQTSPVFLEPCQRILFSHLHLRGSHPATLDEVTPGERLLGLLRSSPKVIPYVKQITLSDFENPWASWLPNDLKLVEALDKLDLKSIEGFRFKRNYRGKWVLLSQPVRRVTVEICQSPALVELSLWWAPLALISVCGPSLKHLEAHDCATGAYASDITPVRRSTEISLESLQLYHSFDLGTVINYILDPSTQVRIDRLQTLRVTASVGDDYTQIPKLFQHCQQSLTTLALVPCTDMLDLAQHVLHIPSFPKLTMLDIEVDATTPNASGERICLAWVAKTLATIPQSNVINTITLKLIFDLSDVPGELNGPTGTTLFSSLQQISAFVLKPGALPLFKLLNVEIHSTNPDDDDVESIRIWTLNALSIPPERSLLRLKAFPHPDYGPGALEP